MHTNKILLLGFTHRDFIFFCFYCFFFSWPWLASVAWSPQEVPSCFRVFFLFFFQRELQGKKKQPAVLQSHSSALVVTVICLFIYLFAWSVCLWRLPIGIPAIRAWLYGCFLFWLLSTISVYLCHHIRLSALTGCMYVGVLFLLLFFLT